MKEFSPVEAWGHAAPSGKAKRNTFRKPAGTQVFHDEHDKSEKQEKHLSARQKATLAAMQRAKKPAKSADRDENQSNQRPGTADSQAERPATSDSRVRPGSADKRRERPASADSNNRAQKPDRPNSAGNRSGDRTFDDTSEPEESEIEKEKKSRNVLFRISALSSMSGETDLDRKATQTSAFVYGWGQEITTTIIMSPKFDLLIGLVVVANSVTMALESEIEEKSATVVLEVFDLIFLIVFTVELLLRAIALRWFLLQTFSDFLDITIVFAGWIQVILQSVGNSDDDVLQSFQALKVFRALRALRMLRMFVFFDGLWLAVSAFFHALWPLLWTCIFIAIILLIMSQFAVHLVGTSSEFEGVCLDYGAGCNTAYELFGTTVRSTTTLFQIMTLDEWRSVVQPICDRQWFTYIFFYFYISIASLGLMNLVTAVVVENSMQRTLRNDEFIRIKKFQETEEEKEEIRDLLTEISIHGFEPGELLKVKDKWKTLKIMLDAIDITSGEDMQRLAEAVDVNGDGDVSLVEFLDFCLMMKGLSHDAIRMAFFQIMTECTDKWTAMNRILQKEHAWILNSAVVARLEREVREVVDSGNYEENEPEMPHAELIAEFRKTVKDDRKTTLERKPTLKGERPTLTGAAGGKSMLLKRQLRRKETFWKGKAKKSAIDFRLTKEHSRSSGKEVTVREITSDNDLLQELRALSSEMQAQTLEVEKQEKNMGQLRCSIHEEVLSKIPADVRVRPSMASAFGEDEDGPLFPEQLRSLSMA